jgi:hypothetical protein
MVYLYINQLTDEMFSVIHSMTNQKLEKIEDETVLEDGIKLNYYCRNNLKTSKKVIEILEQDGYKLIKDKGLIKIFVKNPLIV